MGRLLTEPSETARAGAPSEPIEEPRARRLSQGFLVEFVRLIMVALLAVGGWEVGSSLGRGTSGSHLVGIVLGSGLGYVLGGIFGRETASAVSAVEREFARVSAAEILAGGIGLIIGLVLASLLSLPLYHLPAAAALPSVAFLYLTIGYLGYKSGRHKSDELFGLFGVKPRVAGTAPGAVAVLDSSAILDGRIISLIRMGFLSGTLLVPRAVLEELQAVADSSNPARRMRGRRALDLLVGLRRDPSVDLSFVEEIDRSTDAVDVQLVRLARARGAALVTNDSGLAKVAAALDVPVRSIHALADALRPTVVAGEVVSLRLTRRGKEAGQGVGYLDDGTMVVVERGEPLVGETVEVTVTNALQTSTGQLVFAEPGPG